MVGRGVGVRQREIGPRQLSRPVVHPPGLPERPNRGQARRGSSSGPDPPSPGATWSPRGAVERVRSSLRRQVRANRALPTGPGVAPGRPRIAGPTCRLGNGCQGPRIECMTALVSRFAWLQDVPPGEPAARIRYPSQLHYSPRPRLAGFTPDCPPAHAPLYPQAEALNPPRRSDLGRQPSDPCQRPGRSLNWRVGLSVRAAPR